MELIAAVATPAGVGALGVVRLTGDGCAPAARRLLRLKGELAPRFATRCEALDAEGRPLDDAVATFFPAAQSPTGEDLLEISAHGSPLILAAILAAARAAGARPAEPGEFTKRAFLNGKLDLAQAEAVCALIRARSDAARRAALRQLRGGLSERLAAVREPLFEMLARVEAGLDHPEEDLPSLPLAEARGEARRALEAVSTLAHSYERGRLAAEGARVCLVGRPNAGKSSLLNALLGRERAIVCPEPGTTRDVLEELATVEGAPAILIDTAGLRECSSDSAEGIGQRRASEALETSDVSVLVVDGSRAPDDEDARVHARLRAEARAARRPLVEVVNKADVLAACWEGQAPLRVSARRGTGLAALSAAVAASLEATAGPGDEGELVTSARHRDALQRAARALRCALSPEAASHDRLARDLRDALSALGEIDGATTSEDLLGAIFSRFCVGK